MKKILTFTFGFFLFVISANSAHAFSGSGGGTSDSPYLITRCSQFLEIASNLSSYYKQANDIDCTGTSFSSISGSFGGTLDGNNYAISNITITGKGFFESTNDAVIKNVRLISGSVTNAGSQVGSLIGASSGNLTVSHVSSALNLSSTGDSGGFIGRVFEATGDTVLIEKCSFTGNITTSDLGTAGGIIGYAAVGSSSTIPNVTIRDCYTSGTYTSDYIIGGIIGYSGSNPENTEIVSIINSYSTMTAVGNSADYAGGLVGYLPWGQITDSFAAPTFSGTITYKGGIAGYSSPSDVDISGVYFDRYIAGTSSCGGTGGTLSCTAVNSGNSNPNYFKGDNTNAPLNSWNFTDIWQTSIGGYPTLRGFISPSSSGFSSSSSSSSTSSSCTTQAPLSAPNLFQMAVSRTSVNLFFAPVSGANSSYVISYGFDENANNFATSFNYGYSSGVISYQINSLFPGKWYFKVRGQNGCMPGEWSFVKSIKVI